ncbi:MAG: hypothetical protein KAR33_09610, partial [Candidatus Thorarchaeota archaeon]|nr:hypothetical protein [Candidatus Thorarchaeota archaeon]
TDHQVNITNGNIATDWIYGWSWGRSVNGGFSITLNTANVTNLIKYTAIFTLSGLDYADAIVSVRLEVRAIRTGITANFIQNVAAGSNVSVVVTYENLDHSTGITGASILSNAGSYSWIELGAGQYNVTYYLWDQPAGTYSYDITALLSQHDPASMIVDLVLELVRTELTADSSILLLNWSEYIDLVVYYDNLDIGGLVPGADVRATLSGMEFVMTSNGSAYEVSIDSSIVTAGTYLITVNASKTLFETRLMQVTVVITVLETTFVSLGDVYSVSVVSGESLNVTVYYESLALGAVSGASVSYSWDYGVGAMLTTGQPGYYSAIVDTTGTPVNIYTLYVRANKSNHVEASIYFSLEVSLVDTELTPIGEATLRVVYGGIATLAVNYTNVNLESPIINGSLQFRIGGSNYTGTLTETAPGIYNATIETSQLYSSTFSMYIVASKPGYETGLLSMLLEVERIDTVLTGPSLPVEMVYEQITEVYFNYTDIHYGLPIENATLEYRWQGGTGLCEEIGNGLYRVFVNSSEVIPGGYIFYVTATKFNYDAATTSMSVGVSPIEMEVIVNNLYDVPVGDPLTIEIQVNDISYNRTVEGVEGSIFWAGLSLTLAPVEGVPGNYTFVISSDTGLNSYDITILVNKLHHQSVSTIITVIVRPIATSLTTEDGNNFVSAFQGDYLEIIVQFTDTDHDLPITGATISVSDAANVLPEGALTITESTTVDGQYIIAFVVPANFEFELVIHVSLGQEYQQLDVPITVVATAAPSDPLTQFLMFGGSIGVIFALIGALLWVKIFSVPKLIRVMNGMIKSVSKGKVPESPDCSGRDQLLHDIINEGLEPVNIYKPIDEIPEYTIDFQVPEMESLLAELAIITGLEEADVAAFRADLSRMKPSERPGFLNEVIKQEKARRADELAEKQPEAVDATRVVTVEELQEVGERLLKMGLPQEHVKEILESAKEMTRAELDTVLEQIDKSMEQ